MHRIAVVGSINMDYFIESEILPKVGETVLGENFFLSIGGKGANQAVAAARLGGNVSLFGSVGEDENSHIIIKKLENENINLGNLQSVKGLPTGAAFIELCQSENRIIVVPGANNSTNVDYVKNVASELLNYDVIVFQLETPIEMIEYLVPLLNDHGKTIILNPAPAQTLGEELLKKITYVTPNEHEYNLVFNTNLSMEELLKKYPNKLIITCGSEGVRFFDGKEIKLVPSIQVTPVDTTGAGDTFSGAFAVAVAEGNDLEDSIRFGNIAAGISVTKKGAQTGMPKRNDVTQFVKEKEYKDEKGHTEAN
ncbi:ribokinase [Sporosarcina globispora]|uniref:Ribokinase n=1 Tax=Sporosarcina globispora TaxID=1459 RepID=A0A0M0G9I5_SPOGL|nr:ribokinase [Sporosarcina globispora]KON86197.1 ribokinase [Sporosarcina globispora]